ncbi:MAG: molybdopterin converting factor subunit 1 [Pseudomonadota bacterium]
MKLLYFAWLKTKTGCAQETLARPDGVDNVQALLTWQQGRGAGFADGFADLTALRVAVNQEYADPSHPVGDDDEVAFFPPVTGG